MPRKASANKRGGAPGDAAIAAFLRTEGMAWLNVPNIVGVSVGPKHKGGVESDEIAVIFDVVAKLSHVADIVRATSRPIPDSIRIGNQRLPTDVVEAWPEAHEADPRSRLDPVPGGCSVGTDYETGTLGGIVRDRRTGASLGLSNWHVLAALNAQGDTRQPGPGHGGTASPQFALGGLQRKALTATVDAALTALGSRRSDAQILGLGVRVEGVRAPVVGDRVAKMGCETGVTYGLVKKLGKAILLNMTGAPAHRMLVCEIAADPGRPSPGGISRKGDSGACWMLVGSDGAVTGTMVALHVAGSGPGTAYGCHADLVFAALDIEPLREAEAPAFKSLASADVSGPESADRYRIQARRGLLVRGGPGTEFPAVDGRAHGDIVQVIGRDGPWFKVDLAGDGIADGFMHSAFLELCSDIAMGALPPAP